MGDIVQQAQMAGLFDGSLSSCQAELQELMRQIDIMVNNKRLEWEASIKVAEGKVRQRDEEIVTIKMALDVKTAETNRLTHELSGMDRTQKEIVTQYEQQVDQLRRELVALQKSYEKLQRHHGKQNDSVEKVKEESEVKLRKARVDLRMAESKIEDFEGQAHEWDVQRRAYKKQVEGLETQRQKLAEKCQSAQQDANAYKHQLAKRQQALDQSDLDFRTRIVHIEGQLQRAQDTLDGKNSAIQRLEELLEDAGKKKAVTEDENRQLLEDVGRKEHQRQMLETEVSSLQHELEAKDERLCLLQKENKEQMAMFQSKVSSRETMLRSHEDESRMRTIQASEETSRLRAQLQDSQRKIQDLIESEARLKMEINRLENRLDTVQGDNASLNIELTERIEELRRLDNEARHHQVNAKQNQLDEGIGRHLETELAGLRHEVQSLTGALTQRNTMVDSLRSKLTITEQCLREEMERKERSCSELQIANAELEALRVENRSLQDTYPHVQRVNGIEREMAEGQSREGTLGPGQTLQHLTSGYNQDVDINVLQSQLQAIQRQLKMAQSNSLPGSSLSGVAAQDRGVRSSPRSSPARMRPGLDPSRNRPSSSPQRSRDPGPRSGMIDNNAHMSLQNQNFARMYQQQTNLASPHRNIQERAHNHQETPDSEMMHSLETGSLESESPLPSPPTFNSILGPEDDDKMEVISSVDVSSLSDLGLTSSEIRSNRPPSRESVGTRFLREDQQHQAELERILSAHVQDLEFKTNDALAKHSQRLAQSNGETEL